MSKMVSNIEWQKIINAHPYEVIMTASGPQCRKCGKGVACWLEMDESPCSCKKEVPVKIETTCPRCNSPMSVWTAFGEFMMRCEKCEYMDASPKDTEEKVF